MRLHYREYGERGAPAVLLLHGLFGSSNNWHPIARRLETQFHVVSPDLRNHGRSPHAGPMDYPAMAGDVLELLDQLDIDQTLLVGHSMGGKAAMWLTLNHQRRVRGLVSVDMAPVRYSHSFDDILSALESIRLNTLRNRADVDAALGDHLHEPGLRAYLLQNLVRDGERWRWRINLPELRRHARDITGFPDTRPSLQFPGKALFIYGGQSHYVTDEDTGPIRQLFPFARLRVIPEAGHWVYSEAPDAFMDALLPFLQSA